MANKLHYHIHHESQHPTLSYMRIHVASDVREPKVYKTRVAIEREIGMREGRGEGLFGISACRNPLLADGACCD